MTIGRHSVLLFPDPVAGTWADAGVSNPSFDTTPTYTGWRPAPFTQALTDANQTVPGAVRQYGNPTSPYTASIRQEAALVVPRQDVAQYRVLADLAVSVPSTAYYGVGFGDTQEAATAGPYWAGSDHAAAPGGALALPVPGRYQLDATVVPADVNPAFGWVSPLVQVQASQQGVVTYYSIRLELLEGLPEDISCLVDEVAIHHGREDTTEQPEAATATVALDLAGAALPTAADVGSIVQVVTQVGTMRSTRFQGRITDFSLGWDEAGEDTPEAKQAQLIATSFMADLGRRVVNDVGTWPAELDGARVQRILGLAGLDPDPTTSDPGTVTVLPTVVEPRSAMEAAQEAAESALGTVWHTKAGSVRYADADHRRNLPTSLVLDSCDVLVTPTWSRSLQGMVNSVVVSYGSPQASVAAEAPESVARYGLYDQTIGTVLAAEADAAELAGLLIARNSTPVWLMSNLPLAVEDLSAEETQALLALNMHDLLQVVNLPGVGDAPTTANLWVEGWTERLAWETHELELAVSGYCRTAPPPRWDDVSLDQTWDTFGTATWNDAACLGPPIETDRWTDVPASVRWDTVPGDPTWDTYTGEAV